MTKLTLYQGDCLQAFKEVPNESVDLIITSPPYNVGIDYGTYKDNLEFSEYCKWVKTWITECYRVNKIGGRICINIPIYGNTKIKENKIETFIDKFIPMLREAGYTLREALTWLKAYDENTDLFCGGNTAWGSWKSPSNPCCRSFTEFILVAHKIEPKIQHEGKSDLTKEEFLKFTRNYWIMPSDSKEEHPAVFPEELPYRCIKLYSYIGDTILDPFLGSGTTMKVARRLNRNCIGMELDPQNIKLIKRETFFGSTLENVEFEFKDLTPLLTS